MTLKLMHGHEYVPCTVLSLELSPREVEFTQHGCCLSCVTSLGQFLAHFGGQTLTVLHLFLRSGGTKGWPGSFY